MYGNEYGSTPNLLAQQLSKAECGPRNPTTRERLLLAKKLLSEQLAVVEEALKALDENPEFERVHNLISKAL